MTLLGQGHLNANSNFADLRVRVRIRLLRSGLWLGLRLYFAESRFTVRK